MILKKVTYCMALFMLVSLLASGLYAGEDNKININSATVEELAAVPGLDREMAEKIIAARDENGEFVDLDELLDIDGIDVGLLRKLKKHLKIEALDGCNC